MVGTFALEHSLKDIKHLASEMRVNVSRQRVLAVCHSEEMPPWAKIKINITKGL
jgi:hypothetical protein